MANKLKSNSQEVTEEETSTAGEEIEEDIEGIEIGVTAPEDMMTEDPEETLAIDQKDVSTVLNKDILPDNALNVFFLLFLSQKTKRIRKLQRRRSKRQRRLQKRRPKREKRRPKRERRGQRLQKKKQKQKR